MENSKSRRSDALQAQVGSCLDAHIKAGHSVVAAISGGIDSLALLHCLRELAPDRQFALSALHVHHGLSPNADDWEAHCRIICAEWNVPLIIQRVAVERGSRDGLEAAARRVRHDVFANACCDWVALAHHRNDQAETLLFNLLRGTGLRGAAAMSETNGRLLRPLLDVGRADIEAYARASGLRWREDESNGDTGFSRNYLRHETLAGLESRFPGATANLAAATQRFAEANELLDDLAVLDIGPHVPDFPLSIDVLTQLDEPRARNVLRYLLQQRHIGIPSEERLREALRQLTHAAADRHPAIIFGAHRIFRRAGKVNVEPVAG